MIRKLTNLFILTIFIWLIWSFSGRNTPINDPNSYLSITEEINPSDTLARNIIGIQPYMEVSDYYNQIVFKNKLRSYLVAATSKQFINKNTLVVYPEYIGTWLLFLGEKRNLAEKETLEEAINIMIYSNAFDYFLGYLKTGDEENTKVSSLFRMKAKVMLAAYYETFSELSLETSSYIVAGSIVLPEPRVVDGEIYLTLNGPLYNASFIFDPDGKVVGDPILKAFTDSREGTFTEATDPKNSIVFELPFGKTAIMLCNDSWHKETYANAINEEAEIIVVCSFCDGDGDMIPKWAGYDEMISPSNLSTDDLGESTNLEAWEKYGLAEQIKYTKATVALNVFFRGDMWDLGSAGQPMAILNKNVLPVTPAEQGGVWSLNF